MTQFVHQSILHVFILFSYQNYTVPKFKTSILSCFGTLWGLDRFYTHGLSSHLHLCRDNLEYLEGDIETNLTVIHEIS